MNLTEKIIKGITEAEFEINPELQKKQPKLTVIYNALQSAGWEMSDTFTPKDGTHRMHWFHPKLNEVHIEIDFNEGGVVVGPIRLYPPIEDDGTVGEHTWPATVSGVMDMTNEWVGYHEASIGSSKSPEQTLKQLRDRMKAVGWHHKKSTSGGGQPYYVKMMFDHPDLAELIEVAIGNDGEIQKAMIGTYKGGIWPIDPDMDTIVARAKKAATWATPKKPQKKNLWEIDQLNNMLKQIGWEAKAIGGAGSYHNVVEFTYPKMYPLHISVMYSSSGDITEAKIIKPGMMTSVVPPSPEHVYKKAQELMQKAGL